jgi:hypothetical protein
MTLIFFLSGGVKTTFRNPFPLRRLQLPLGSGNAMAASETFELSSKAFTNSAISAR